MIKNKRMIAITIAFIGLIVLGILGFTYAFFTAGVVGNDVAAPTVLETADLRLVFTDTQIITMNNVLPGASQTKTFTISNIGNRRINYDINMIDITNTFINDELIYSLTSTNGGATITNTSSPTMNGTIVSGTIEPNIIQTYTMTITFKETGANQNTNQGATFTGKLQINASSAYSENATFTIPETLGTVVPTQTKKVNIIGNYYGIVSCTSSDTNVAECTPSQNEITILGKNIGTANITITENNKNMEVTYTVTITPTVYNIMLANNIPQSDLNINFQLASSETNGKGLYYTEDNNTNGEDGERIYYFRGRVENNWVSFGGYLWRIVRTTSEGGVKLVYAGNGIGTSSGFINTATAFNTNYNVKYYVGYTYNTSSYTGTQTDSTVKTVIDTWYNTNLSTYSSYLSDIAIYCNDRSNETIEESKISYPPRYRETNFNPTYACPSANASRYTVSTETGNGYLTNPIALLTTDEIMYAGLGDFSSTNSYIMDNSTNVRWWTLSPCLFGGSIANAYTFHVRPSGSTASEYVVETYGVRPSISLKSNILVTGGNGTKATPYLIG